MFVFVVLFISCKSETTFTRTPLEVVTDQGISIEVYDFENLRPFLQQKDEVVYVINFWATWCKPCVEFWNSSFELMKVRAQEKDFTFPYLFDDDQKIYPQYGATRTPHIYILKKEKGNLVVSYIGAIDDNYKDATLVKVKYVEDAVDALLKGKKPATTETKAIGCSIKV